MDQMARYKVPYITTGGSSDALSDMFAEKPKKYANWFRVMHLSSDHSRVNCGFIEDVIVGKMGATKMAVMAENALWTRDMVDDMVAFFKEKGLDVVYSEYFDIETKDFTTIFAKIKDSDADFIFEASAHVDGSVYIKQWHAVQGPMIAGVNGCGTSARYWADSDGKCAYEAMDTQGCYRVEFTEKSLPYYDKYVEVFGEAPGYPSGWTYDTMYILKEAIEKAKSTEPEKIVAALEKTDHIGVNGREVFNDRHNLIYGDGYYQLAMVQWTPEGEPVAVWPEDYAAKEYELPPWLRDKYPKK